jgi:hypothetical protein
MSSTSQLWLDRARELAAMCMIGDGVLALLDRRRHIHLWLRGPEAWERAVEPLVGRPALTDLAAVEIGLGLWLARRQTAR